MSLEPGQMDWANAQAGDAPSNYERLMVPGMFTVFGRRLLEIAAPQPGDRVLDVACGTGIVARLAAEAIGPTGVVVGADIGEPMLAFARSVPATPRAAEIDYRQGPAGALPVEDGSADLATCQQGLQFFDDRPAALAEMRRALVAGGRVAIATQGPIEASPIFAAIAVALGRHVSPQAVEMVQAPFVLDDPDELGAMLETAGFEQVEAHAEIVEISFQPFESTPQVVLGSPIGPVLAGVPPERRDAYEQDVRDALASRREDDGAARAPHRLVFATGTNP